MSKSDILSLGPQLPNGDVSFIRTRESEGEVTVEAGTIELIEESKIPETEGEVLRLRHIGDNRYEVTSTTRTGPPQVNSKAYRTGWENIFGAKQTVGQA
jgi:hypothetical protein